MLQFSSKTEAAWLFGAAIVERYSTIKAQDRPEGYADLAREVVGTPFDVIVSFGMPMTARLKAATSTVPIVAVSGDPIRFGLISSLAHPGGNITGSALTPVSKSGASTLSCFPKRY